MTKMLYRVINTDPSIVHADYEIDWPPKPGIDLINKLVKPLLNDSWIEHVSVLYDFHNVGKLEPSDMFVDEIGALKSLPINREATLIYHTFTNDRRKPKSPLTNLAFIYGTAIIFERRIWY